MRLSLESTADKKVLDKNAQKCHVAGVSSTTALPLVKFDQDISSSLELRKFNDSADWELAHELLNEEHSLGAGREAGDRLGQFVLQNGKPVAVLIWCASAWHLKGRDELIGWDPVTRAKRLKLVVQLRRFLILEETRRPNLASQCLGLSLRSLQSQWFREHAYEPLVAESFSNPESHEGTVYKATNWTQAGQTKGFSQARPKEEQTDYYISNDTPKKLWLKPLHKNAYQLLCAPELPAKNEKGEGLPAGARCPLNHGQLKSLSDAFKELSDPRRPQSRRHPKNALLILIALGLLMGARDMKNVWKNVLKLSQRQREVIGLKVKEKGSTRLRMPGYDCLNDFMNLINPQEFAHVLTSWLQANQGTLPQSLALDGKSIGDGKVGMIVTLCNHEDGRPVALAVANGKKEDSEVSEGRKLLANEEVNLVNKVVTLDPLHNKFDTLDVIVKKGGDYIVGTKENTSARLETAQRATKSSPLLNLKQKKHMDA